MNALTGPLTMSSHSVHLSSGIGHQFDVQYSARDESYQDVDNIATYVYRSHLVAKLGPHLCHANAATQVTSHSK